jgi:D-tyrosyl-tRNA(Tyr) deacylase
MGPGRLPRRPAMLRAAAAPVRRVIGLIQRVLRARVDVGDRTVGAIDEGLLVLVGVRHGDGRASADRLLERLLTYRVFADDAGRMNRDVTEVRGGLLLVPQFTLAADTRNGTRPGFSAAASPQTARELFDYLLERARARHRPVAAGEFAAHMRVELVNDGPVTFWLESPASP